MYSLSPIQCWYKTDFNEEVDKNVEFHRSQSDQIKIWATE